MRSNRPDAAAVIHNWLYEIEADKGTLPEAQQRGISKAVSWVRVGIYSYNEPEDLLQIVSSQIIRVAARVPEFAPLVPDRSVQRLNELLTDDTTGPFFMFAFAKGLDDFVSEEPKLVEFWRGVLASDEHFGQEVRSDHRVMLEIAIDGALQTVQPDLGGHTL